MIMIMRKLIYEMPLGHNSMLLFRNAFGAYSLKLIKCVRENMINSVYDCMRYSKDVRTQLTQISSGFQPLRIYSYWSTSVNQR
jgi:hypothetical protein